MAQQHLRAVRSVDLSELLKRANEEAVRDLLVAARPRDWPLVFAIDASACPRPEAECSPGREFHHHSCAGFHGSDGAAIAGWAFQWLARLSFAHDSWTAPQDQVRVGARDDATRQAAVQVIAHSARLRAAGEGGIPLYVLDAGYDEAPLTWDLRNHLGDVQVLVRFRNDRVMYRDPPPRIPGLPGRPRRHGSGSDRFECKDPATWGPPGHELSLHDDQYGQVSVKSWGGLHPRLICRGRFEGFAKPPVIGAMSSGSPSPGSRTAARPPARCGSGGPAPACRTWACSGAPTFTDSTSSTPAGSQSMSWAGTRPPSATRSRSPAGPGS